MDNNNYNKQEYIDVLKSIVDDVNIDHKKTSRFD